MKNYLRFKPYILLAVIVCFSAADLSGSHSAFAEAVLPEGLVIEDTFHPGTGQPVGKVLLVEGNAVIIHAGMEQRGYIARKDTPLYENDTVITQENGRISFQFADGTVLSLASGTKIVISRSIYDSEGKNRSTFLSMSLGKARFWVKKLTDFKNSEFKVKTKTAIVGVRGSDYVIEADERFTQVSTLADTQIDVVSLYATCERDGTNCEIEQHLLTDFQKVIIEKGDIPFDTEKLTPEEIEQIYREFPEVSSDLTDLTDTDFAAFAEEAVGSAETGVLFSEDDIIMPEEAEAVQTPDLAELELYIMTDADMADEVDEIMESRNERLPEPPPPPDVYE